MYDDYDALAPSSVFQKKLLIITIMIADQEVTRILFIILFISCSALYILFLT